MKVLQRFDNGYFTRMMLQRKSGMSPITPDFLKQASAGQRSASLIGQNGRQRPWRAPEGTGRCIQGSKIAC